MAEEKESDPTQTIEEWAIGDSHFDPELDTTPEPASLPRVIVDANGRPHAADGKFVKPPETPLEAPAEPAKHTHSALVADLARDHGIPQDEIDATPPEVLQHTVRHLNRQLQTHREKESRYLSQPGTQAAAPPPAPEPPPDELAELGEIGKDLDPAFAGFLRKLVRENRELRQRVDGIQGHMTQKHNETRDQWVDRLFDEHGDELKFGNKSAGKGLTTDQQLRRRQIVQAAALKAGPGAAEKAIVEMIPVVLKDLFGEKAAPVAPTTENGRVSRVSPEEWEQAGLRRPTQRRESPEPKGVGRAQRAVANSLRDKGVPLDDEGGIEEASLPD